MPAKAPSGYYLPSEAAKRLNIPLKTFYCQLSEGKIRCERYVPEGKKEGYFKKDKIDSIAQYYDLGSALHSQDPLIFKRVDSEAELRGIVDLCVQIYGRSGTPTFAQRVAMWRKNPEIYYIVKQGDIVTGYISLTWLHDDLLSAFMQPCGKDRAELLKLYGGPEYIHEFRPGQQIDHLFASISVRAGFSAKDHREYASALLRGASQILLEYAKRGMPVGTLYACSQRGEGVQLARKLGMKEIIFANDPEFRYRLNLKESTHRIFKAYRQYVLKGE